VNKIEALRILLEPLKDHRIVVCNGMIGREVYSVADRPNQFYMIGSMGIAASIALGLAHCAQKERIAVFEGDGNTLMGLGNVAQIGAEKPEYFVHICLDNNAHASTGGQRTISSRVPLEEIARGAGYRWTKRATDPEQLKNGISEALAARGPAFLLVEVEPGTIKGVPRVEIEPAEIASRFRSNVTGGQSRTA
jgi:sulfopyruvate decarboxylase subunit beta